MFSDAFVVLVALRNSAIGAHAGARIGLTRLRKTGSEDVEEAIRAVCSGAMAHLGCRWAAADHDERDPLEEHFVTVLRWITGVA